MYLGSQEIFILNLNKPNTIVGRCAGTGLIALDAILNGKPTTPAKFSTGGSCGNVLTILSFLGWESHPIGRLSLGESAKIVTNDLEKWGVDTSLISKEPKGSTPVIIHRIFKDKDGNPKHRFEFRDPDSKKWLPSYRPLLSRNISNTIERMPKCDVFYFDRINRASIELAKYNYNRGTLVFFEPSSLSDKKLFAECLQYTHIIKFSSERIKGYDELYSSAKVPLEIETLGGVGLRFRFKSNEWQFLSAFKISNLVDSAGAGDWSSAGIIHRLGQNGSNGFNSIKRDELVSALKFGQLLGAINCHFDGARGLMYNMSYSNFSSFVENNINKLDVEINSGNYNEEPVEMIQMPSLSSVLTLS